MPAGVLPGPIRPGIFFDGQPVEWPGRIHREGSLQVHPDGSLQVHPDGSLQVHPDGSLQVHPEGS